MSKRLTPNQKEFNRIMENLNEFIESRENKGYKFDFIIPSMPKRVTRQYLTELKNISRTDLLNRANFYNLQTGQQIMSGLQADKLHADQSKLEYYEKFQDIQNQVDKMFTLQDNSMTDIILNGFWATALKFNSEFNLQLEKDISVMIAQYGRKAMAIAIQECAKKGIIIDNKTAYDFKTYSEYLLELFAHLPFTTEQRETLLDILPESGDEFEID